MRGVQGVPWQQDRLIEVTAHALKLKVELEHLQEIAPDFVDFVVTNTVYRLSDLLQERVRDAARHLTITGGS